MSNHIDLSARYSIKTGHSREQNALASTPDNDTLVIESSDASRSQLWYFESTHIDSYYRLHTEDKGNDYSLDIYNYEGSQTIDLRFRETEDLQGQYWRLDQQNDGSVKISNNHNGPETYLDIQDDTLKPMLAARDSPNQKWSLSSIGSPASTHTSTTTPTVNSASVPSDRSSASSSLKLGPGPIAGIAVGGAVLILAVAGVIFWRHKKARDAKILPPPISTIREGYVHA
jgi:hypothetical protein